MVVELRLVFNPSFELLGLVLNYFAIRGLSIAKNICLINNAISYTESNNISGLLLFVDFEKAFDTTAWAFVEKTLHHFGFGSSLIKWINLLYREIQSCVINNGWSAGFFELSRGVI